MRFPYSEEAERLVIKNAYGNRRYLEWPMRLTTITGISMPPMAMRTVRSPFQHGETYLGFSLRPRPVQIALHMRGCSRYEMWTMRRELIDLINPLLGTLRIRAEFRDGSIFELHDVVYDAGFEVGTDGQSEPTTQALGARFIAHDPVWFRYPEQATGPALTVVQDLVFGDVSPPSTMIFPITFGAVHISQTLNITIDGNWMAFPTIELVGPLYHPLIENDTTGEKLELDYVITDGEVVTITTRFGDKTVTNADGDNLIGYLTTDSDLATFHLDPHPVTTNGVNAVSFWAGNASVDSAIIVRWYNRYLGL